MFIEKDVLCGAGVGIGVDGVPPVCGGMSAAQSSFGLIRAEMPFDEVHRTLPRYLVGGSLVVGAGGWAGCCGCRCLAPVLR